MNAWIAVGIAGLALAISGITAWLSFFRRGRLRMTQPTIIFFGPDGTSIEDHRPPLKVFLPYNVQSRNKTSRFGCTATRPIWRGAVVFAWDPRA